MKPKQNKTGKIDIIICGNLKEIMNHGVKILRVTGYQPELYKVEVEKMQNQKYEYTESCPDHES
jgi:choline kinase